MKPTIIWIAAALAASNAMAQDDAAEAAETDETATETQESAPVATGVSPDQPRAMSGMSILGNEEAPKALVIVPWKTSEMGDELSLSDNLDDQATPVDKEVFLRELAYYEIRQSESR